MAGLCTGPGLETIGGKIQVAGAREAAWPGDGACTIAASNGLRVDPATEELWVPPDAQILFEQGVQTGADRTVVPATSAVKALSQLDLTMEVPACGRALFRASLQGGYAGWRAYSGKLWVLQRFVTLSINGAPATPFGSRPSTSGIPSPSPTTRSTRWSGARRSSTAYCGAGPSRSRAGEAQR